MRIRLKEPDRGQPDASATHRNRQNPWQGLASMLGPLAPAAGGAGRRDEDGVRTAVIVRADDGSVGLSFLRSGGASAGPFEVTRLVPQSAAERSRAVEVGDHFRAVDGRDVTALDDAAVAGLFRGAPGTTLKLLLCDGPPLQPQPGPLDDKEVAAAVQWARSRKLPAPTMSDFEALLRLLQPMAIPLAEVCMQLPSRPRHLQHGLQRTDSAWTWLRR